MTSKPKCLQTSFPHGIKVTEFQVDVKEYYLSVSIAEISTFNNSMRGSYHRENELKEKLTALKELTELWCGEMEYNEVEFLFHQH